MRKLVRQQTYFRIRRIKKKAKSDWFEKNPAKTYSIATIIAFVSLIATYESSTTSLDIASKALADQQKSEASSDQTVKWFENSFNKQLISQQTSARANESQALTNKNQAEAMVKQDSIQIENRNSFLFLNKPHVNLFSFERVDSIPNREYFELHFNNIGQRDCEILHLLFSVVNYQRGYDTIFTSKINEFKSNQSNVFVMRGYNVPLSVAHDESTLYYCEILSRDILTNKLFIDTTFLKNPEIKNNDYSQELFNDTDIIVMRNYINTYNFSHNIRTYKTIKQSSILEKTSILNKDIKDSHTVLVGNYTTNPCNAGPASGCWKDTVTASVGDIVSVQLYFHNCGDFTLQNVGAGLWPKISNLEKVHEIFGLLAEDNGLKKGQAYVITKKKTVLRFIPNSVRIIYDHSLKLYGVNGQESIFGVFGINIGNIKPDWYYQGDLTADFKVCSK